MCLFHVDKVLGLVLVLLRISTDSTEVVLALAAPHEPLPVQFSSTRLVDTRARPDNVFHKSRSERGNTGFSVLS